MKSPVRFAIQGFGLFAEGSLMPAFRQCSKAKLVAITKQNESEAKQKARKYGISLAASTQGWEKLLNDPEIDAIYVATPNSVHYQDTVTALKAGKHVIVEKPMGVNSAECEKMVTVARECHRELMVAQCLRFNTTLLYIKDLMASGKLGDPIAITTDFMSQGRQSKRKWKYDKIIAGGGAGFDLGVHLIDSIRFLAHSPLRQMNFFRSPPSFSKSGVDEVATFHLAFENNLIARATASYFGPRHTYLEVYATKGYVRAFDWQPSNIKVRVEQEIDGHFTSKNIQNSDYYKDEIDAFAGCILNGEKSPIPGEEGLENQRIIDQLNQS